MYSLFEGLKVRRYVCISLDPVRTIFNRSIQYNLYLVYEESAWALYEYVLEVDGQNFQSCRNG